jgi:diaminohydroxyphosphoribosylaminopyrimidine deaminase/5-amino-6-(5-phosphoribosylamino)uracil reductase
VVGERPVPVDARVFAHPQPAIVTLSRDLNAILAGLFARGVRRVIVEGGPTLSTAFVAAGLVDEYVIYLAPTLIGGPFSVLGDIGVGGIGEQRRLTVQAVERLGDDIVVSAWPASAQPHLTAEGVR